MEDIALIDAVHMREASEHSERVRRALNTTESPELLRILIDYYFTKGSIGALKILTTLKSSHAQDFFDKLQECIHVKGTRLGVLRLLAFALNSQISWLYKISGHPLFSSILHYLRESHDILVLATSSLVVAALIPLIPSYLEDYIKELMDIFYRLATIRSMHMFESVPSQLHTHMDVAVYYLFIQLYSLFPINLVHSLKQKAQLPQHRQNFQEYIAPLFRHVQLHPHLVIGVGLAYETSKERWCSLDQHDIATLGLSISLDPSLVLQATGTEGKVSTPITPGKHGSYFDEGPGLTVCAPEPCSPTKHAALVPPGNTVAMVPPGNTVAMVPPGNTIAIVPPGNTVAMGSHGHTVAMEPHGNLPPGNTIAMVFPGNAAGPTQSAPTSDSCAGDSTRSAGLLTTSQLQEVCRRLRHGYDNTLGLSTHSDSSSVAMTTPASPPSEPSNGDDRTNVVHVQTYSPTASLGDTESLQNRHVTHSVSHTSVDHTPSGHTSASVRHTPIGHASFEENKVITPHGGRSAILPGAASSLGSPSLPMVLSPPDSVRKLLSNLLFFGPKATPSSSTIPSSSSTILSSTIPVEAEVGKDCLENAIPDHQGDLNHDDQGGLSHYNQGDLCDHLSHGSQDVPADEECRLKYYQVEADGGDNGQPSTQATGRAQGALQERPTKKTQQDPDMTDQTLTREDVGVYRPASPEEGHATIIHNSFTGRHVDAALLSPRPHYHRVLLGNERCPDPSPLHLLNRLLECGELVHRGSADSIPLSEMEGMNWMYFGGCPHLEEVGIMQNQVTLLHSQLLFERCQCQQHAMRSRQVLCKARGMDRAQEQVASLKEQVSCQKELILSMQADQRVKIGRLEEQCKKMEEVNRHLASVNASLVSKNQLLAAEVERLEKMNTELSQDLMRANSQVCTLKTQLHFVEAQLLTSRHLQGKVERLSQELLLLGEAHHQLCLSLVLRRKDLPTHQWDLERSVLQKEKESAQTSMLTLVGELKGMEMQVCELQQRLNEKDMQIDTLLREAQVMQTQCHEKIKATESKYQTLVITSQQLYAHILELKGRPLPKKKSSHKRCKSQPTVS